MTDTYYHNEDVPPSDADTQVELYQQAREVVADSLPEARVMFAKIEDTLGGLFTEAEQSGNESAMNAINDTWERVQGMSAIVVRQGAALSGANTAIDAVSGQRDAIAKELKDLLNAIDSADVDHPRLVELHQTIQEFEMEYVETFAYDIMNETMLNRIDDVLGTVLPEGATSRGRIMIADSIVDLMMGYRRPNDEQKALIIALAKSFDIPAGGA